MKQFKTILIATITTALLLNESKGLEAIDTTPLTEAIAAFNDKATRDPIGKKETPLTLEEVIGAILLYERPKEAPISDELLGQFKTIASTKKLPGNAEFEVLTGYDRGGMFIFDVWSVRIRIDRPDSSSYAFQIRERVVGVRTLPEEIQRLEAFIEAEGVEKWVGGYRIIDHKNDLQKRLERLPIEEAASLAAPNTVPADEISEDSQ